MNIKTNILLLGDITGANGIAVIEKYIPIIKKKYQVDFIIANGENASKQFGLKKNDYKKIINAGVNVVTTGNHAFDKKEIFDYIKDEKQLLIPGNWNKNIPYPGTVIQKTKSKINIRVTNVMGRVFMPCFVDNPYDYVDQIIKKDNSDIHIIDFHAESSAEKYAFAHNYDGKINILVGTHTHVQTADEKILENGTGYITDLGMNGPYNSIIGVEKDESIFVNKTGLRTKFIAATGEMQFSGLLVFFEGKKIKKLQRININPYKNEY